MTAAVVAVGDSWECWAWWRELILRGQLSAFPVLVVILQGEEKPADLGSESPGSRRWQGCWWTLWRRWNIYTNGIVALRACVRVNADMRVCARVRRDRELLVSCSHLKWSGVNKVEWRWIMHYTLNNGTDERFFWAVIEQNLLWVWKMVEERRQREEDRGKRGERDKMMRWDTGRERGHRKRWEERMGNKRHEESKTGE